MKNFLSNIVNSQMFVSKLQLHGEKMLLQKLIKKQNFDNFIRQIIEDPS